MRTELGMWIAELGMWIVDCGVGIADCGVGIDEYAKTQSLLYRQHTLGIKR